MALSPPGLSSLFGYTYYVKRHNWLPRKNCLTSVFLLITPYLSLSTFYYHPTQRRNWCLPSFPGCSYRHTHSYWDTYLLRIISLHYTARPRITSHLTDTTISRSIALLLVVRWAHHLLISSSTFSKPTPSDSPLHRQETLYRRIRRCRDSLVCQDVQDAFLTN